MTIQQKNSHHRPEVFLPPEETAKQRDYAARCAGMLTERFGEEHPLLALVHSYGCQQNTSDGERLMGMLAEMGFGFTEDPEQADLILYNTCAVRENAEVKVFGNVGELSHLKARRPELLIGLCGCMTQQQHIAEKVRRSYPQVDLGCSGRGPSGGRGRIPGNHPSGAECQFLWK